MIQTVDISDKSALGRTTEEFLQLCKGPSRIDVPGNDPTRTRFVITLLHGNEPSGTFAIREWLLREEQPETNLTFLIVSVDAALSSPGFAHRHLPGCRDLNRCFGAPYDTDDEGRLAKEILELIDAVQPELILDIHNTSGSGPAFAVATSDRDEHVAITSYFCRRMIVTDLRLGALIEIGRDSIPAVVLECGGPSDPSSIDAAGIALSAIVNQSDLFELPTTGGVDVLYEPVRFELVEGATLCFSDLESNTLDADLVLPGHAVQFNFGIQKEGTVIGKLGSRGLDALKIAAPDGTRPVDQYFLDDDGVLKTRHSLHFFMVTPDVEIALEDCICYLVPDTIT